MEREFLLYPSTWIGAAFLAMPRMLAMFSLLPIFNRQALPGLLRIGVAFGFALFVVPAFVPDALHIAQQPARLFSIVAKEALIGFLLGFLLALPLWAMDVMGAYIDNQRGASIAATINPLTGHDTSPLGELFSQTGMIILLITGGLFIILELVYASYQIWPVTRMLPRWSDDAGLIFLGLADKLMWLAVMLSAPVVFSMFLAEVGLGIVSRFVPQLQVFFLAMPIKSAVAMFVLAVYTASLVGYFRDEYVDMSPRMLELIASMFKEVRP